MDLTFWIACSVSKAVAEAAAVVTPDVTFLLANQPVAAKHLRAAVPLNQLAAAKHLLLVVVLLSQLAVAKHQLVAVPQNQLAVAKHLLLAAVLQNQLAVAKHLLLVAVLLSQLAVAKHLLATAVAVLLAAQRAAVDCYRSCLDAAKVATVSATAVAMHLHADAKHPCLADVQLSQLVDAKHLYLADVLLLQLAVAKHHLATADAILAAKRRDAFLTSCSAT